jgi:hypothetical protein
VFDKVEGMKLVDGPDFDCIRFEASGFDAEEPQRPSIKPLTAVLAISA